MNARAEQQIYHREEKNSEFLSLRGELSRLLIPIEKSQLLTKFEERQIHNLLTGLQSKDFAGNPEKVLKNFFTLFNQPVRRTPEFNRLRNQVYLAFETHGLLQRFTDQETAPLEAHLYQNVAEYYEKTKAKKKKISENEKNYVAELEYAILNIANPDDIASLQKIEQLLQKTLPAYSYADMEKARKMGTPIGIGTDEYRQLKEKIRLFLENQKNKLEGQDTKEESTPDALKTHEGEPPVNLPMAEVPENITDADFAYGAAGASELPQVRALTFVRPARGKKNLHTSATPASMGSISSLESVENHHDPLPPEDVYDPHFIGDINLTGEPTNALPSLTRSPTAEYHPQTAHLWTEDDDALLNGSFEIFDGEDSLERSPTNPYPPEVPRNSIARSLELALLAYHPTPTEAKAYNSIQKAVAAYTSEPSEANRQHIIEILDETQNEISERLVDNPKHIEYHTKEFIDLTARLYNILESKIQDIDEQPTLEQAGPELAFIPSLKNYLQTHDSETSEWLEQYETDIIRDVLDIIQKGDSFEEIQAFLGEVVQWQQQNTINFDGSFLEVFQPVCAFYEVDIPPYLARPSILQTNRGMPALQVARTLFEASPQRRVERNTVAQFTPPLTRMDSPEPIVLHDDPMATSVEAVPEKKVDDLVDPTVVEPAEEEEVDYLPARITGNAPGTEGKNRDEEADEINVHDTSTAEPQDQEEREILEEILDLEPEELKDFRRNYPLMAAEEQTMARNIISHLRSENLKPEEFTQMIKNIPFNQVLSRYFTEFLRTIDTLFFENANRTLIDAMDVHTLHEVGTEGNAKIFGSYGEMKRRGIDRKKAEEATTVKAKQGSLRQNIRAALGEIQAAYIPEEFYRHFKNPEDFTREKVIDILSGERIKLSNELHQNKITAGEIGRAFEGEEPSFLGKLFSSKERTWAVKRNQILSNRLALRWRAMDQMLKKISSILP